VNAYRSITTDEIVRAVRSLAEGKHDNGFVMMAGKKVVLDTAAYLIESLQAEIRAAKDAARAAQDANSEAGNTISQLQSEKWDLESQLAKSQRRAQRARNELCLKCGKYHDAHNGACDGCIWKEI
jgi:dTDP-4-dehydrorhamnose reductase